MFIIDYIRAGYPALYVNTLEEERAFRTIREEIGSTLDVYIWKVTTGLYKEGTNHITDGLASSLMDTLEYIDSVDDGDCAYFLFNPKLSKLPQDAVQKFRDVAYTLRTRGSHIICIGIYTELPAELQEVVTILDFPLPTRGELRELFSFIIDSYSDVLNAPVPEDYIDLAAENAMGLTEMRAENALALSIVKSGGIDLEIIQEEKRQILKQSSAIEYIPTDGMRYALGGLQNLKDYVSIHAAYFHKPQEAERFGVVNPPRGIFLLGLPGTGKTLSAKYIASTMNLPLYRLNVGALFKSYVGSSEEETEKAIQIVSSAAPAVLLIDEFEKLMSGIESSGKSDAGVTAKVIARLLTWFQENDSLIYKVATANSLRGIDPSFIRRGRWDEVFFVDLPNENARYSIFEIHLQKRRIHFEPKTIVSFAEKTEGFSGADIESVIDSAVLRSYYENKEISEECIHFYIDETIPIGIMNKEEIEAFREWAKGRAVPA